MRQPTNIDRIIARNMRIIRKSCQLNLKDVSNDLAVSYQQLRKYETSDNRISAGKLWELSLLYKTPVQKFFKDEL